MPYFIFDRTPESYSCNPPILKFLVNDSDVPNFSPISGSSNSFQTYAFAPTSIDSVKLNVTC